MASCVYFIQAGARGPIKIGSAVDPQERLGVLQVGNHETLTLLASVEGGQDLEREIHAELVDGRIRGEWFRPETPGLTRLIAWARELEQVGVPICDVCAGPVTRPRRDYCSDSCATERFRERSRDWRRSKRAAA